MSGDVGDGEEERTLLLDASVTIALANIDAFEVLSSAEGRIAIPLAVKEEVTSTPARRMLEESFDDDIITPLPAFEAVPDYAQEKARTHLNTEDGNSGDTELLGGLLA